MLTMHPTLLIGPADWDAERMPREAFLARIAALWGVCDGDVAGAIVFGNARQHAELAWLTGFTPKLEAGLTLIPRRGAPRLFVGGGVNMLPAAQPLTWVESLLPLRGAAEAIAEWVREVGPSGRLALIGGDAMPFDLHRDIAAALAPASADDITPRLVPLMRRKSARELAALREACATLDVAVAALGAAWRSGATVTVAILAAEEAANRAGAQDVRTLFSLDGGRTLGPFTGSDARRVDPLQVYVAVRQRGYWAEGFAMFSTMPSAAQLAASAVLRAGIAGMLPGMPRHILGTAIAMQPSHPVIARSPIVDIGLSLEQKYPEGPDEMLTAGSTYSLRVGILDAGEAAIASAMIAVTANGADVLWEQAQ